MFVKAREECLDIIENYILGTWEMHLVRREKEKIIRVANDMKKECLVYEGIEGKPRVLSVKARCKIFKKN